MILQKWAALQKNKTMKIILTLFIATLLLSFSQLQAQNAHFITSATIEYEKTANMFALLKKQINKDNEAFYQPMYDQYVKNQPQFKKLKSTLNFADDKTLFTPVADESNSSNFFGNSALV